MRRSLILWGSALAVVAVAADAVDRVAPLGTYAERERPLVLRKTFPTRRASLLTPPTRRGWSTQWMPSSCSDCGRRPEAIPAGGPDNPGPAAILRPGGLPPTPRRSATSSPIRRPTPGRSWWRNCLPVHYGERWGQHWLDVVLADRWHSTISPTAPQRHRDCVIRAFNNDRPYDGFVAGNSPATDRPKEEKRSSPPASTTWDRCAERR
jgi:hypothetical protein